MSTKAENFDYVIVGTGFASAFFLHRVLERESSKARVLVLERGRADSHAWRMLHRNKARRQVVSSTDYRDTFENATPEKPWVYTPSLGGSSNCWYGCTPRFTPADFRMKTTYGVGEDWPLSYEELEPHYSDVEEIMQISGPDDQKVWPRRKPYPQPPHHLTDVDKRLAATFPGLYFAQPTARPRRATKRRPACCASGVCSLCPIDSKFTVLNELSDLFRDPRVTLRVGCRATAIRYANRTADALRYADGTSESEVGGGLFVLGANAIFNPHILLSSGLEHPALGRNLSEQVSVSVRAHLDGIESFQGSTLITANGYMFYDGEHRRDHAGALVEGAQPLSFRHESGKHRQIGHFKLIFEDLPLERNRVERTKEGNARTVFEGYSSYALRALALAHETASRLTQSLPVEKLEISSPTKTEAHILGTTKMGTDPTTSIVDRFLVHHEVRNVVVLGGSTFPTTTPANPSLTICALSLRSADHVMSSRQP